MMLIRAVAVLLCCTLQTSAGVAESFGDDGPRIHENPTSAAVMSVLEACMQCHGRDGIGTSPEFPNLAGQNPAYLAGQLQAFRSGTRKNELTNAIAEGLENATIVELAKYWSNVPVVIAMSDAPVEARSAHVSPMQFPEEFPRDFVEYRRDEDAASRSVSIYYAYGPSTSAVLPQRRLRSGVSRHGNRSDSCGSRK